MPITVRWAHNGPFAVCDTVAEAAEMLRLGAALEAPSPKETAKPSADKPDPPPISEDQAMDRFLFELKPNQKNFLSALSHYPDGVKGEDLAREIGGESRQFGAVVGAISKNAKRNGIRIKQLMLSEMRFEGSRRYRFFQPKALLQRYAGKIVAQTALRLAG
jgi:hypothetical protein